MNIFLFKTYIEIAKFQQNMGNNKPELSVMPTVSSSRLNI